MTNIDFKLEIGKVLDWLKNELAGIRTGRANPALVENIQVDYYGSKAPLKQVASISVVGPREILIQPWSRDSIVDIEKAIAGSDINISPVNMGEAIKINIPPLTEETRRNFIKVLGGKIEEARIKIRRARDDARKTIQETERNKEVSEDEKFKQLEELDKIVDEYNKKMDKMREDKEKEIMTV